MNVSDASTQSQSHSASSLTSNMLVMKFNGKNYMLWKKQIESMLRLRGVYNSLVHEAPSDAGSVTRAKSEERAE